VILTLIQNFFSLDRQSFADVTITDAGVDTVAFLEAADGLVGLFGMIDAYSPT